MESVTITRKSGKTAPLISECTNADLAQKLRSTNDCRDLGDCLIQAIIGYQQSAMDSTFVTHAMPPFTPKQFAELLSVNPGRVSEYIKKGMPAEVDHANGCEPKIYLNKALPWVIQHIRGGADGDGPQERLWEAKAQHQELVNERERSESPPTKVFLINEAPEINLELSQAHYEALKTRGFKIIAHCPALDKAVIVQLWDNRLSFSIDCEAFPPSPAQ